jgi:hypothetical protein
MLSSDTAVDVTNKLKHETALCFAMLQLVASYLLIFEEDKFGFDISSLYLFITTRKPT